ncbi:MAG: 2-amino-4-hydroxy-6-hydroxymethyldihydropteridine diphosphokinase [Nitrospinota bacterium]
MRESITAYLGIGSNKLDREAYIKSAIDLINKREMVEVLKESSYYMSEPQDLKDQEWFLNMVLKIKTQLEPTELLAVSKEIEAKLGREKNIRYGPRVIDIDILLYGSYKIESSELTIPHAKLQKRRFALIPLVELEPDLVDPDSNKRLSEILSLIVTSSQRVTKVSK